MCCVAKCNSDGTWIWRNSVLPKSAPNSNTQGRHITTSKSKSDVYLTMFSSARNVEFYNPADQINNFSKIAYNKSPFDTNNNDIFGIVAKINVSTGDWQWVSSICPWTNADDGQNRYVLMESLCSNYFFTNNIIVLFNTASPFFRAYNSTETGNTGTNGIQNVASYDGATIILEIDENGNWNIPGDSSKFYLNISAKSFNGVYLPSRFVSNPTNNLFCNRDNDDIIISSFNNFNSSLYGESKNLSIPSPLPQFGAFIGKFSLEFSSEMKFPVVLLENAQKDTIGHFVRHSICPIHYTSDVLEQGTLYYLRPFDGGLQSTDSSKQFIGVGYTPNSYILSFN